MADADTRERAFDVERYWDYAWWNTMLLLAVHLESCRTNNNSGFYAMRWFLYALTSHVHPLHIYFLSQISPDFYTVFDSFNGHHYHLLDSLHLLEALLKALFKAASLCQLNRKRWTNTIHNTNGKAAALWTMHPNPHHKLLNFSRAPWGRCRCHGCQPKYLWWVTSPAGSSKHELRPSAGLWALSCHETQV